MTVTAAVLTTRANSGLLSGEGFKAFVTVVWDSSYPTGGEALDLSAIFPNEVYGGAVYADTLNDGGYECTYTRATAGAPATGMLQAWWTNNDAGGAQDPLIEVADMTSLAAMDSQRWCFWGR